MQKRAPTQHDITCTCCGIKVRVSVHRRFLCDSCFRFGESRKQHVSSEVFARRLNEWLMENKVCDPDEDEIVSGKG
jgi:hypothetical protein